MESFAKGGAAAIRAGIEHALASGLAVDGVKCIVVSGGNGAASADKSPVVTGEYLGARSRRRGAAGGVVLPARASFECQLAGGCAGLHALGAARPLSPCPSSTPQA